MNAAEAIAAAVAAPDWRVGRDTIRTPYGDVTLATSHLPTYGAFLTTATGPWAAVGKLPEDERWTQTRVEAKAMHAAFKAALEAL